MRVPLLTQDKVAAVQERETAGWRVLRVGDGVGGASAVPAVRGGVGRGRAGSGPVLERAGAVVARDAVPVAALRAVLAVRHLAGALSPSPWLSWGGPGRGGVAVPVGPDGRCLPRVAARNGIAGRPVARRAVTGRAAAAGVLR
ncbi:hypothetical protein K353_00307 [Kitasatospora sp. SolWspMP-SS2h]|uniref:hypothetical protein n=1 Tax=Kitasatospora sp. SolWspMP-SS2h TaxID=1305729 RepID=UPI000DB9DBB2|nr:hypothetical protein [Kitasatospora sp. SolWspMP-SS2h]RAJ47106.1 hypothetical protein K353_00307 [Kitasatospora sp. SolWspMP-SS2h]